MSVEFLPTCPHPPVYTWAENSKYMYMTFTGVTISNQPYFLHLSFNLRSTPTWQHCLFKIRRLFSKTANQASDNDAKLGKLSS